MRKTLVCFFLIFSFIGINQPKLKPGIHSAPWPFRPNILLLVTEDLCPVIPPFGDSTITTSALSRLAREGVQYNHVFTPSGVCAPSLEAIALGMYPSRVGAMHMLHGFWAAGRPSAALTKAQRKSFPPDILFALLPDDKLKVIAPSLGYEPSRILEF
jgi:Sulfatase